jgi:signal transduction histidine kinase
MRALRDGLQAGGPHRDRKVPHVLRQGRGGNACGHQHQPFRGGPLHQEPAPEFAAAAGSFFIDLGFKRNDLDMVRKGWDVLQRANKKIGSLVMNMLNYSREMELKLEKYDVNALIYEILHQVDDTAVERGVALIPELQLNIRNQDRPRQDVRLVPESHHEG